MNQKSRQPSTIESHLRSRPGRYTLWILGLCIVLFGQFEGQQTLSLLSSSLGWGCFFLSLKGRRFQSGFGWALIICLIQNQWLASPHYHGMGIYFGFFFVNVIIAAGFGLIAHMFHYERFTLHQGLMLSGFWIFFEYGRLFIFNGFPFNMVGELLLSHHYTAQGAALLGVFGLSFWVFFTNFCFVHFIKKMNAKRAALWMMAIILPWVYGYYWTHANHATGGDDFRVAVVQTGWLAEEKHEFPNQADRYMGPLKIWEHLLSLMPTQDKAYDLILLPEATVAFDLNFAAYPIEEIFLMIDRSGIVYSKESIPDLTEPHVEIEEGQIYVSNAFIARWLSNIYQSDLIFGVLEDEGAKTYNAAALVSPGKKGIQVYRKRHLVPMAEYLPFGFLQSYIAKFGIEATFAAGEGAKVLRGKQVYSPSICIEEGYNKLIREGRLQGANILVNCTNDIWFPKTTLPRDHLKQGRLRAIENGCSVVRSCNSGVSSIIDPFGKVHKELSDYHADESLVSGTIEMVISPIAFNTPFLVLGNNGIFLLSIVFVLTYFYKGGMLRRTGTEKAKM